MKRPLVALGIGFLLAASSPAVAQTQVPNDGAFDALSAGNQKIVSAIHESQIGSTREMNGESLLTRDEIAAMKADGGWGKTYKQLHEQGYVTEKNLGQAVSSYNHQNKAPKQIVITTGSGQQHTVGRDKGPKTATAKSGKAQSGGRKLGNSRSTVITTGAGTSYGAGAATHSSAGGGSKGRGHGRGHSKKGK
jgi:hypothetical protein